MPKYSNYAALSTYDVGGESWFFGHVDSLGLRGSPFPGSIYYSYYFGYVKRSLFQLLSCFSKFVMPERTEQ